MAHWNQCPKPFVNFEFFASAFLHSTTSPGKAILKKFVHNFTLTRRYTTKCTSKVFCLVLF